MPAVRMFGRKWRVSSDFLPLFATVGLVFHFIWVIFIIVWPFGITHVHRCTDNKAGRQFLAAVCLFFGLYVLSFIQELLIVVIGLRGQGSLHTFCKVCLNWEKVFIIQHNKRSCKQPCDAPLGTPLETRKRRAMQPVLYTQILNWVGQLGVVSEYPYTSSLYLL